MKTTNLIQLSVVVLCLVHGSRSEDTLLDAFNDIYSTCLVNLNTDCIQPKALEWLSKVIEKREIHITNDLSIVKNDSATIIAEDQDEPESARDSRVDLLSKVDGFLATHYMHIRYPKAIISQHVPSFMMSTLNRFIPDSVHMPLEEGNPNEGRGLVKKVLIPFLLGLKFKTTVLLPLAFALIALKAWKALTLGLISLVVSTAVVVFKLAKPKVINYEVVHYPHHHHLNAHYDHLEHHLEHHLEPHHHLEHLDVHQVPHAHIDTHFDHLAPHGHIDTHFDHLAPHAHIDTHLAAHDIAYPAHL
ncbi:uncharacterized protein LOC129566740 [Sitodiplosis mosellana]|uniref:uncharacterized protein LOC129566740 n=1 Tax=Sitodiplosis mosellana TaxID=263140 RepID=UPI002443B837|nr:uncharacterized protein LOC129566740 [Sitodiplosis mosellana]